MKKLFVFGLLAILAMSVAALAAPGHKGAPEFVPQLTEDKLTKIVFIRYAPGKDPVCDNDGVCEPRENWKSCPNDCPKGEEPIPEPEPSGCYGFLSGSMPKWNWVEDYYYSTNDLREASKWATSMWDAETSATIFGNSLPGASQWGKYDYKNSIVYGDYGNPDVIAVTAIWYRGKNIYEYDIMFDVDYFPASGPGKYDLDTVALHEFGHAAGLGDLYNVECADEVMYGYYKGEKHDLRAGDIAGITALYGA